MSAGETTSSPAGAPPAAKAAAETRTIGGSRTIEGIVTSDKMQKTRSVQVSRLEKHPKYGKFLRRNTTFKVHDEQEISHEGDIVLIAETRPLSKTKRWRLVQVLVKSKGIVPRGPEVLAAPGEALAPPEKAGEGGGA